MPLGIERKYQEVRTSVINKAGEVRARITKFSDENPGAVVGIMGGGSWWSNADRLYYC